MEERLLVDFLGPVGVADEDDLDMPVAAGQEDVEQHVEPLGEVLHVLGHRARHVHQAEHHRLRHRLRHGLEAAIADVDRIDEGNALGLGSQRLDLDQQARRGASRRCRPRISASSSAICLPASAAAARRGAPSPAARCGSPRCSPASPTSNSRRAASPRLSTSASLRLARSGSSRSSRNRSTNSSRVSTKRKSSSPSPSPGCEPRPPPPLRARDDVAFDELLVARQHRVARAAFGAETRLVHPIERDRDLAALQNILDVPAFGGFLHRALNQGLGAAQEPLAVFQALAAWIQPPIDDEHRHYAHPQFVALLRPPQPACFTRMYHSTSRRTWRSV